MFKQIFKNVFNKKKSNIKQNIEEYDFVKENDIEEELESIKKEKLEKEDNYNCEHSFKDFSLEEEEEYKANNPNVEDFLKCFDLENDTEKKETEKDSNFENLLDIFNLEEDECKEEDPNKYKENVLIFGKEDYFANQSIFEILKERFRKGTGGLWITNLKEYTNVIALIQNDAKYFEYEERVFPIFEIEDEFIDNIINKGHIYIILKKEEYDEEYTNIITEYKLERMIESNIEDHYIPIIISQEIREAEKILDTMKKHYEKKICFFMYYETLMYIRNEYEAQNYFNSYLILTNNIHKYLFKDYSVYSVNNSEILLKNKDLNKKVMSEIKKVKPMESLFINEEEFRNIKKY